MNKLLKYFELHILIGGLIISVTLAFLMYFQISSPLKYEYDEHLLYTAKLAASQFHHYEIDRIQNAQDVKSNNFIQVAKKLNSIRSAYSEISSIYILRKTKTPNILAFIADADYQEKDMNNNGIIEEDEKAIFPGDLYDASSFPKMIEGFSQPSVEKQIYEDLWGPTQSAYAPIKNKQNETIAILGIDITKEIAAKHLKKAKCHAVFMFFIFLMVITYTSYLFKKEKLLLETNILTQKENQRLEELNAVKNNIISIASHELRTPMSVIKSYTSLLQKEASKGNNPEQIKFLEKISKNNNQMIELINDMLDISKLEAGKLKPKTKEISIHSFIQSIKKEFSIIFKNKGVKLEYLNPNKLRVKVLADDVLLRRVFTNLLSNALKFTAKKGVVSIELKEHKSNSQKIEISVKDTGIGIPKEKISTIFEKFEQVDSPLQREHNGTGLGLAIVKNIVQAMKGSICCKSKEGKGTTFTFTLKKA